MPPIAPRDVLKPLRLPGYAFLTLTLLLQMLDFIISVLPARFNAVMWRFSVLGGASQSVGNILLLILLLYVFALLLGDRSALASICFLSGILAAVLLLCAAAFSLDAIQLRGRVDATAVSRFDVASVEAVAKFVTQSIVAGLMCLSALRSWRLAQQLEGRRERGADDLVVVRATPSPRSAQD